MGRSFCFLPWINLETYQEGVLRLCCYTTSWGGDCHWQERYHPVTHRIEHMLNTDSFRRIRLQMLNGEYPVECSRCYEEEKKGLSSPRQFLPKNVPFIYTFEDAVRDTKPDGSIDVNLRSVVLRFGNTCNLACRICNPYNSSRWEKEFLLMDKNYFLYLTYREDPTWDFLEFKKDILQTRHSGII